MDGATVALAADAQCDLGESPTYDARTDTLYFVDINRHQILAHAPSGAIGNLRTVATLGEPVGTVALTSDPATLLAALERDVVTVDVASGRVLKVLASAPEAHGVEGMRFNDGKASPQGAFVVGRMHAKWRDGRRGRLYVLPPQPAAGLEEVLPPENAWLPNGMAWAPGGGAVFFADSGAESVCEYAADGRGAPVRGSRRLVADLRGGHAHVPDGLTIDAGGRLWVALGESGAVACYDAQTGAEVGRVALPVRRPTACTFGGPGLGALYVTTRVEAGDGAAPHHGGLFRVDVPGVRGAAPAFEYRL